MRLEKNRDVSEGNVLQHADARSLHETLVIIRDINICKKSLEAIINAIETKIKIYSDLLKNLENRDIDKDFQKYLESIEKHIKDEISRYLNLLYFEKANLEFLNRINDLKNYLCVFYKGSIEIYFFPEELKSSKRNIKEII